MCLLGFIVSYTMAWSFAKPVTDERNRSGQIVESDDRPYRAHWLVFWSAVAVLFFFGFLIAFFIG